jgi:hypothetical protein
MAFSAFVTTVTQDRFVPKVVDNILGGNVLLERLLGNARPWGSGHQLEVPIKYQKSTSGDSYSGFDLLSTTQMNTRVLAAFDPKQNYWAVAASNIQLAVNKGDAAVLDLLAVEMDSAAADMRDELGTQLYADGTGNSSKDIIGLDAAIDDGNGTGTYAGLARSTYTTWVSDLESSSEAISLAKLVDSFDDAKIGSDEPTLIVTTPTIWGTLEGLLTATIAYNPALASTHGFPKVDRFGVKHAGGVGSTGFNAVLFRGYVPVVADEKCASGKVWGINENHLWFARLDHPDYATGKEGFAWSGLKTPTNQDARVGHFFLYGNIICDSCRSHFYQTNKS